MRVERLQLLLRLVFLSALALTGAESFAQWPPGTSNYQLTGEQQTNIFLLNQYMSQPGKGLDLTSIDGLKRLPDLQSAVMNPNSLKGRVGLGVNTSFSDPALGRINYRWIPVFKAEELAVPAQNVLPKSISNFSELSSLVLSPVDQAVYMTQISEIETCPTDPSGTPEGANLPQVLMIDPEVSEYAVVELEPDPSRPDLWVPSSQWTAVQVNEQGVTAIPVKPKAPKSKPVFKPQYYKAGPVSAPVGVNYSQTWLVPEAKRTVNHSLNFQINATRIDQSTLTYESRVPNLGKNSKTHMMALAIVQPMRQSALTGAAFQDELKDGSFRNTFVGYETNKSNRAGTLIVQSTHTGKETNQGVTHTTGFITRLGASTEATGLYQLRTRGIVASAAVTPVRMGDIKTPEKLSSSMNVGVSFTNPFPGKPVTGFVNVGLLKDWSNSSAVGGEVSAGVVFPKSGTTMYVVVPLNYFSDQNGLGPRAQFAVPLNRKPASAPRK
jgi:hypothetical protein